MKKTARELAASGLEWRRREKPRLAASLEISAVTSSAVKLK
jgi:hypothetical protein